jgi:hypothetical protein
MKCSLILSLALGALVEALWPVPSSYKTGNSTLWLERHAKINFNGPSNVGTMLLEQLSFL